MQTLPPWENIDYEVHRSNSIKQANRTDVQVQTPNKVPPLQHRLILYQILNFFKFSSFQLFLYFLNTFSVPVNYAKIKKKIRKIQFDFNCATEECVQHET